MTKKATKLPEHLGIHLFRAYEVWLAQFVDAMNEAGHRWFTPGRANILGRLPREGCKQADLLAATGLTKQALQQMLDGLEQHGIVERVIDPDDRRARLIHFTDKGLTALEDADAIKADVARRFEDRLGQKDLASLESLLKRLVDDASST